MIKNSKLKIKNFSLKQLHLFFFYFTLLFFPTQLGYHLWPPWSFVGGIAIDYLSPTLNFTDVLILLTLFFWFLSSVFKHYNRVSGFGLLPLKNNILSSLKIPVVPVILVVLVVLYVLLAPFYLNPLAHLFKFLKILELALFGFYIVKNITMKQWNNVEILLSVGIIFESLLSIAQFAGQKSLGGVFYYFGERSFTSVTPGIAQTILDGQLFLRPYGTFSHPNSLAGYFLVSLFLILSLRRTRQRSLPRTSRFRGNLFKYLSLFTFYLLLFTLFISFSRSAWFTTALAFSFIGILNINKLLQLIATSKKSVLVFALGFALCTLSFALFSRPILSRLQSLTTTDTQSLEKRLNLNSLAWKMFKSSPVIGVGLNNFIPNLPRFTENQPQIRFYQPAHNIYLLILAESGILGLTIFIYGVYMLIKMSLRASFREAKQSTQIKIYQFLILSPLFIVLVTGLFDHYWLTLQQNQLLLALMFGLVLNKPPHNATYKNK